MCCVPQIFSVQRRHPELAYDLLHPDLPLAGLRLHSDREVPGGGRPGGLDGPARHTEQAREQDPHLTSGKLTKNKFFLFNFSLPRIPTPRPYTSQAHP